MKYLLLSAILILAACRPNKPQPEPEPEPKFVHPSYLSINGITDTITDIYWIEGGRSPSSSLKSRGNPRFSLMIKYGYFPKHEDIYIDVYERKEGVIHSNFYIQIGAQTYWVLPTNDSAHLVTSTYADNLSKFTLVETEFIDWTYNQFDSVWEIGTDTILVSGEFYVPEGVYEE